MIGCLQAMEAMKVASVVGEPLSGRMLLFDALSSRIRIVRYLTLYLHLLIMLMYYIFVLPIFLYFGDLIHLCLEYL